MNQQVHHIIIRPHPNDINIFEEVLEFLPEYLSIMNDYLIVIEKDNSPERHAHIIIFHDYDRIDNKLRNLKQFIQNKIQNRNSILKRFIVVRNPKTEKDKKMVLGYVLKDLVADPTDVSELVLNANVRHTTKNKSFIIDNAGLLLECYQLYQENKIETDKIKNYKDIINVDRKNAVTTVLNYIYKQDPNHMKIEPEIFEKMIKDGYSFLGLSQKTKRDLYLEIKIHLDQINKIELNQVYCEYIKNPDDIDNIGDQLRYFKEHRMWDEINTWYHH